MTALRLRADDIHEVAVGDRRVLLHVPSTSLFELDGPSGGVVDALRRGAAAPDELADRLADRYDGGAVRDAIEEMVRLRIVEGRPPSRPATRAPLPGDALSTLVLGVTNGCNLACTYCYKDDVTRPAAAERLSPEAGRATVDLLLRRSGRRPRVNLTFFGGEPLTALPLIKSLVDYAERRAAKAGKAIDFSLTTNGLLLDDEAIGWLDAHRFGITVSMDGPPEVHNRNRRTAGGAGSYAQVAPRVRRLLERYRSRPVGARVTVTEGAFDVLAVHRHLKDELGFAEAGFAPVTAGLPAGYRLDDGPMRAFFEGLQELGRLWLAEALRGRDIGFTNVSQLVGQLHAGGGKLIPCGAGTSLLAVDPGGRLQLCHRFAGDTAPAFGHVLEGIDDGAVAAFVDRALARAQGCGSCWVRHLCAGGCYHEAHVRHGDLFRITDHYCGLMREWIDFGIGLYVELMAVNPGFLRHRIASGREA